MNRDHPIIRFIEDLWDVTALAGSLTLSFCLWIVWGVIWFPLIDWVYALLRS